jgi:peptidoglycan/LPS O-acetylase OafA/YrhL
VKTTDFLPRIESLRGIAALAVVGYHANARLSGGITYNWFDGFARRAFSAVSNGAGAVVIFFVLSGFVLARSLDSNPNSVRFFRHRAFRLFPAAMAVVALLTVLHWQHGIFVGYEASFDPLDVILNLLMIRSDINSVMWSMTVECVAAPLVLLSVWLYLKHGARPLWIIIAILLALSSWGPYAHLLGGFANLASLYAFVVGTLLHFQGARAAFLIGPTRATYTGIAAIAIYWFCGTRTQSALILMLECLSAATMIVLIVQYPAMRLFRPLDFALVRFYGRISYSFYLLHLLGIEFAVRILDPLAFNALGVSLFITTIFFAIFSVLLTTPVAYLMWRFIETPFIRYGSLFGKPAALRVVAQSEAWLARPRVKNSE